ncbi:MAG TPA: hypothetical protein VFE47_12350 [Tepidisphaeraceae bacterium]|jgi:hypothetical protein|nr:hypothetical protein [Tepidisphaeraceae bacterium]
MKLLLDTHAFIWWDSDPAQLSSRAMAGLPSIHKDPFDRMLIAQANTEVSRDGFFALMLSANAMQAEPREQLFGDFGPRLAQWAAMRGDKANAIFVTVFAPPARVDEIATYVTGYCRGEPRMAKLLAPLEEAGLTFADGKGGELGSCSLLPPKMAAPAAPLPQADGTELRLVLPPVAVNGEILCRVVARFGDGAPVDMWVEKWTGRAWANDTAGMPTMDACEASPPVALDVLANIGVPAEAWPKGCRGRNSKTPGIRRRLFSIELLMIPIFARRD